jgi:hypothetical protein
MKRAPLFGNHPFASTFFEANNANYSKPEQMGTTETQSAKLPRTSKVAI